MIKWKKCKDINSLWEGYIKGNHIFSIVKWTAKYRVFFGYSPVKDAVDVGQYTTLSNAKRACKTLVNRLQY